VESTVVTH